MTTTTSDPASPIRILFWRVAAVATDVALRNRAGILGAWPYLQLALGGLAAYAIGRLFGVWALSAIP